MKITLEVANSKAGFLIELLKNLKFVKVTNTTDWFEDMSEKEKKSIEEGLQDLKSNRVFKHEGVISEARQKITRRK